MSIVRQKNLCAKTRDRKQPYEIWESADSSWRWLVLKKYQIDDDKPYARWFCLVISPIVPDGEYGDVYVSTVKASAHRVDEVKA